MSIPTRFKCGLRWKARRTSTIQIRTKCTTRRGRQQRSRGSRVPAKPWNQYPSDENTTPQQRQCMDWVILQLNQLVGQSTVPPASGLKTFGNNQIDPTSAQIVSAGSRTSAIATGIGYAVTP